jgi:hypothetical protein
VRAYIFRSLLLPHPLHLLRLFLQKQGLLRRLFLDGFECVAFGFGVDFRGLVGGLGVEKGEREFLLFVEGLGVSGNCFGFGLKQECHS